MILLKFLQHVVECLLNNAWRDFAVNLPLWLFRAMDENVDTGSLKFLRTLFDTYLYHMPTTKFEEQWFEMYKILSSLAKNLFFKKSIFDETLTPFCNTFLLLKQLFNGKLLTFRLLLSVF